MKRGCLALLVFTVLMLSYCRKKESTVSNSAYDAALLDTVLKRNGNFYAEDIKSYVDSMYRAIDNPTIIDRFRYYGYYSGYYYHNKRDYPMAMRYSDSMLSVLEDAKVETKYVKEYAGANISKGDAFFAAGNYSEAYKYFFRTKIIASDNLDLCTMSEYTYRLGMVLYRQGKYGDAAKQFIHAFSESEKCEDVISVYWRRQELLNNTGLSYSKAGDQDNAELYFRKGLEFIERKMHQFNIASKDNNVAKAVIYGNLSDVYRARGEYDEAINLLKRNIDINTSSIGDLNDGMLSELKLARIYQLQKRNADMLAVLNRIRTQLPRNPSTDIRMQWNKLMSDYYSANGNLASALRHLETYTALRDSADKMKLELQTADVSGQLQQMENQREIDALKKSREQQGIYLQAVIILSVMALIIIFLIYHNWQNSKRNIAELKILNATVNNQKVRLEEILNNLEEAGLEKDRILRTVAHDLRNPIAGIASISDVMAGQADYTEPQLEMIRLIREASSDTLHLINEIMEVATGHTRRPGKEAVEMNSLLNDSAELLKFTAQEKSQRIVRLTEPGEVFVNANRERLIRVIHNLISNAVKFSPTGSDIIIKSTFDKKHVTISIKDQGIGIPEELGDKVFDVFTKSKRLGTEGEKSFGLGLSICRQIVLEHDGRIWFESPPGQGTTFYVELPVFSGKKEKPAA